MPEHPIKSPRKLIEVALPLDAINAACAREKSIRHGHPSTLHLWWARRPLAAARAVIFAQLVNDPGYQQGGGFKYGKNKKDAAIERRRLFKIIEDLVLWESTTNEEVLGRARAEIRRSWLEVCELNKDHPQASVLFNPEKLPGLHDPFAGGGAIPLEAQRLGLEAYATDLNPVAVLINKAMIELPPKFAGIEPVNADWQEGSAAQKLGKSWPGAAGLADDVRYYGAWMREEAQKRIGHLYPKINAVREKNGAYRHATPEEIQSSVNGTNSTIEELTVIAWIWARTVKSPDPAFSHVEVPLASTFVLCSKEEKPAWVKPIVTGDSYRFTVCHGVPPIDAIEGTKATGRGANFRCIVSGAAISGGYIKARGKADQIGNRLLAVVAESKSGRVYMEPTHEMEEVANRATPLWLPDLEFAKNSRHLTPWAYGISNFRSLFTPRQLTAITCLVAMVSEARQKVLEDARKALRSQDIKSLALDGNGPQAYSEAVSVFLAFAIDKAADYWSSVTSWHSSKELIRNTFGRQAISMVWDFAEINPFSDSAGNISSGLSWAEKALHRMPANGRGYVSQADAQTQDVSQDKFVSTDPPYYDNVPYADLSDFFYVWLRKSLKPVYPNLFSTVAVPKAEELVADSFRHETKVAAEAFFLDGMTKAIRNLANRAHPEAPISIYYAFKQADTKSETQTFSTGWETFLEAVCRAGLQLTGTWPMRTELGNRMRSMDSNALASSIVLVCRKRPVDAPSISRREFTRELNRILPEALDEMTKGSGEERSPVAPVDLSQAIIGPGMAVFSKYSSILEADGSPMSVRTALQLINRFLAEDDFDADTQFCLSWFEKYGWKDGPYGDAETLAVGKGTSVGGVKDAGVIQSGGGNVRLFKWSEYPVEWNPLTDNRTPIWEALHHLIRALKRDGGETASGALLAVMGGKAEAVRQLAYRLYTLCERLGQAEDARAYNDLITSWTGIESAAATAPKPTDGQLPGFENN